MLLGLAEPLAHAEIVIDNIGGSEIGFEGLLQADGYWYDNDVLNLDADAGDGLDHDFGLRRAEIGFKGKGPGNFEWAAGYRSEEHTSELQSLMRISYAVFCLKKKRTKYKSNSNIDHQPQPSKYNKQ